MPKAAWSHPLLLFKFRKFSVYDSEGLGSEGITVKNIFIPGKESKGCVQTFLFIFEGMGCTLVNFWVGGGYPSKTSSNCLFWGCLHPPAHIAEYFNNHKWIIHELTIQITMLRNITIILNWSGTTRLRRTFPRPIWSVWTVGPWVGSATMSWRVTSVGCSGAVWRKRFGRFSPPGRWRVRWCRTTGGCW